MPTALQLTRKEWGAYHPASASEPNPSSSSRLQETRTLLDNARQFGRRIKQQFGVKRVLLFGSLARQSDFQADSDIDLAVEGLHGSQYWDLWRIAEDSFPAHEVDLVELEMASDSMRKAIEKYGIDL